MPNSAGFVSGKKGYVVVLDENGDGNEFPFDSWTKEDSSVLLKRNNFMSRGWNEWLDGFGGFEFTLEGPLAVGNPIPLATGVEYTVFFGLDADGPIEFVGLVMLEKIRKDNKAEDGPKWVVTGKSQGDFDPFT